MVPSSSSYALLASLLTTWFVGLASAELEPIDDSECDCFMTKGSSSEFFSHHLFFDFRHLSEYAGVPNVIEDPEEGTAADATSDVFTDEAWERIWGIQNWNNSNLGKKPSDGMLLMINSASNIYIEENVDDGDSSSTYMTMRTARLKDFQTSAEFESISTDYRFLSVRMYARTIGAPGACTAMFTYRDAEKLKDIQEADIEFLTKDPNDRVQYTNQPSFTSYGDDVPEATRNATIPNGKTWGDWMVHRLDWTPGKTTWYIDEEEVAAIEFQAPRDGSKVMFNSWSDGGSWSGTMVAGEEAYLQIQWIEMVFNTTDAEKRRRDLGLAGHKLGDILEMKGEMGFEGLVRREENECCKVVCSIDETAEPGVPVLISNDTSLAHRDSRGMEPIWMSTLLTVMIPLLVFPPML